MKKAHRYLAQRVVDLKKELDEVKDVAEREIRSAQWEIEKLKRMCEPLAEKVDRVHKNQQGANAHMGWINRMIFNLTGKSYSPHTGRDMDVDFDVKVIDSKSALPNKLI